MNRQLTRTIATACLHRVALTEVILHGEADSSLTKTPLLTLVSEPYEIDKEYKGDKNLDGA